MAVGILARIVDIEALVAVMLHASHVVSPSDELFDKLHDEGRFPEPGARLVETAGLGTLTIEILPSSVRRKYITEGAARSMHLA